MRRWNGWGKEGTNYPLNDAPVIWLNEQIGSPYPRHDKSLEKTILTISPPTLPEHPLISFDPVNRLRHSYGCSLPDWVSKRFGHIPRFTDAVAFPQTEREIALLFDYARENHLTIIPFGGGTSVVGGVTPSPSTPPSLTIDMSRMNELEALDPRSLLATFGAGVKGPDVERLLAPHGLMLGHFPQSYELSTLGGWIAARSSGQQSIFFGRIEDHYAGGRVITPVGPLEFLPHPASAAGPDLKQVILGSEGRAGIITSAFVRVHRIPKHEEYHSFFFPDWEEAVEAVREISQRRIPLSMIRLSNPKETEANLRLAGHEILVSIAHKGLGLIGQKHNEKVMLLISATGSSQMVRNAFRETLTVSRKYHGFYTGRYMGNTWKRSRFKTPYLRNTLWDEGYAIDTLESVVPWRDVIPVTKEITEGISKAAEQFNEKVYAFAHLSHLYETGSSFYVTYIFRILPDPDQMLAFWHSMKKAASEAIISHKGSISHQHGVGTDHSPYLMAEKGNLGIEVIRSTLKTLDPDGMMNAGKLLL